MIPIAETAARVYGYMVQDYSGQWGMDREAWDWVPGVGVIAMMEYGETFRRREVLDDLHEWEQRNRAKSAELKVINAIAPFAIYAPLCRHTGDTYYYESSVRAAEWLLREAPRTREGAFEHTVTEEAQFPEQVWADTVFMAVLFLARTARLTGHAEYAKEAVEQSLIHMRLLQDKETDVLFHGWNCITSDHMSAARWTRANAWVAAGIPEIVSEVGGLAPIPDELRIRYERLMKGLIRYQQQDGLWSTVMDHPDYYREASGSAGIACGILRGIRSGWLSSELAEAAGRALPALVERIEADGCLSGVSGGTPVMESVEAYNRIACYPTLYGQGLMLMLLNAFEAAKAEEEGR
ncbi:glycoside hydrolase family 88 protein [Paenibacillus aurantius]|uniref:Glycoside hydrolase family 88 protein n=1 Tax=Paenibacillus aurantius TaxID=2918900 RepID=A0AA96LHU1_9BACL|nr:glycoside hydrolase family 88 protein [Paenibacillus aurantius]WNQ13248.1 glycoside hydrolase family 88 protein [Paenibacillus aurantius]